jgi:putative membrane protein
MMLGTAYTWVLGLHILAVIAWMAGLLMLPRLYVYHMQADPGSNMDRVFKHAELRLLRIIMNPAMILVVLLGGTLVWLNIRGEGWRFLLHPWIIVKLAFVLFLMVWHGFLARARRTFETGTNTHTEKFWRMTNELPFLAAIVIVLAVTTKIGG